MDDSPLLEIGLPLALALIMFGLGLSLTVADFRRVMRSPRAVAAVLVLQFLLLPWVALGLAVGFRLDPVLAVGLVLLAASPGGPSANLISHLLRGDVALNVTLTAITTLVSAVAIPVQTNLAIAHFGLRGEIGVQLGRMVPVFLVILVPTAVGVLVRRRAPAFAGRADRPVRALAILVLVLAALNVVIAEWEHLGEYLRQVGLATTLFSVAGVVSGFAVASALRLSRAQAIACSVEVGIHNTPVVLTVALTALHSTRAAIPAVVYTLTMYVVVIGLGVLLARLPRDSRSAGRVGGTVGGMPADERPQPGDVVVDVDEERLDQERQRDGEERADGAQHPRPEHQGQEGHGR